MIFCEGDGCGAILAVPPAILNPPFSILADLPQRATGLNSRHAALNFNKLNHQTQITYA
jgi:hypothetical protein